MQPQPDDRNKNDLVYRFDLDFKLRDIVHASTAAPTFFPRAHCAGYSARQPYVSCICCLGRAGHSIVHSPAADVYRQPLTVAAVLTAAEVLPLNGSLSKPDEPDKEPLLLCDGGVVANNPSPEAVAFTSLAYGTNNEPLRLQVGCSRFCLCVRQALCMHV